MYDFRIAEVLNLVRKTTPFLVFRCLIYVGITLAYVIGTGAGAGIGYGVGIIGNNPEGFGLWGGLTGFGLVGAAAYMLREYLLYLVKAGHIAVLVELMDGRTLPEGCRQIEHAQKVVRERFTDASVLFGVDQLIKGILGAFNRAIFSITALLPVPGLQGLVKFINTVINLLLTYLDEVILAYIIRQRADNPWEASRTALILYAQNYKVFLKNAFFLAAFIWGLTFLVFLIILAPVAALVAFLPGVGGTLTLLVALLFTWSVKQAVIEPIGMTALMQVFLKVTAGQQADAEWEARLEKVSMKFDELKQLARATARTGTLAETSAETDVRASS